MAAMTLAEDICPVPNIAPMNGQADMDAAIAVVKTWPMLDLPGVAVEIRPVVEDYSQFE